jgi:hypothetical protein
MAPTNLALHAICYKVYFLHDALLVLRYLALEEKTALSDLVGFGDFFPIDVEVLLDEAVAAELVVFGGIEGDFADESEQLLLELFVVVKQQGGSAWKHLSSQYHICILDLLCQGIYRTHSQLSSKLSNFFGLPSKTLSLQRPASTSPLTFLYTPTPFLLLFLNSP